MFNVHGHRDKFKTSFYNKFGECPFFKSVLRKLEVCKMQLLQAFKRRFSGMDDSIYGPRCLTLDMRRHYIFLILKKVLHSRV